MRVLMRSLGVSRIELGLFGERRPRLLLVCGSSLRSLSLDLRLVPVRRLRRFLKHGSWRRLRPGLLARCGRRSRSWGITLCLVSVQSRWVR